jgi:hypothetical protein
MKIRRIRTGGQTGVDRAAMNISRKYGIPLCGWMIWQTTKVFFFCRLLRWICVAEGDIIPMQIHAHPAGGT